jgi:glycosyltransferase involved in cell wall biosynthesis
LRIVLLNQYYAPDEAATSQLLADLGSGLVGAGHEVSAVCGNRSYADPGKCYARRESIDGVNVRRVRTTGYGRRRSLGRIIDYLTFLLGASGILLFSKRPDVIISLSTPPMVAALGWLLARMRGASSFYWVMDVYPDLAFELGVVNARSLTGRLFAFITGITLRSSDAVIALGETMAERLRSAGARRLVTIHNWADGEAIREGAGRAAARRSEWGWDGRFVLLYSGNHGLAHEFDTILDAAELLADHPSVLFAFIGGGPRLEELQRNAHERSLANVSFRPYVKRALLGESLAAADVHLITLREGMPGLLVPSKIYGVLAAGRPTIYVGPGRGELSDIIAEGRCGARVANGDAEALVQAVLRYEQDRSLREQEGRRARELFERRFTRSHGVDAFIRLHDSHAGR